MSANTSIEWTDRTWNPVRGCSVISPGCTNCYAMKMAHRFSGEGKAFAGLTKQTKAGPQWTGQIRVVEDALLEPLRWRKPQRIFVNSMSDLFHEDVPDAFIDRVFAVMALADRHTFQVLTKRPQRMHDYLTAEDTVTRIELQLWELHADDTTNAMPIGPLRNVWLGVSVEDQQRADERIPLLLQTPAAVRFISAEPLLGPVDLWRWLGGKNGHPETRGSVCISSGRNGRTGDRSGRDDLASGGAPRESMDWPDERSAVQTSPGREGQGLSQRARDDRRKESDGTRSSSSVAPLQGSDSNRSDGEPWERPEIRQQTGQPGTGDPRGTNGTRDSSAGLEPNTELTERLSWVIVGGESGPGARMYNLEWARALVEQCEAAEVPVFVKQLGAVPVLPDAVWRAQERLPLLSATNHRKVGDEWAPLHFHDSKGGDMAEWPLELRVRQFPRVEATS